MQCDACNSTDRVRLWSGNPNGYLCASCRCAKVESAEEENEPEIEDFYRRADEDYEDWRDQNAISE